MKSASEEERLAVDQAVDKFISAGLYSFPQFRARTTFPIFSRYKKKPNASLSWTAIS